MAAICNNEKQSGGIDKTTEGEREGHTERYKGEEKIAWQSQRDGGDSHAGQSNTESGRQSERQTFRASHSQRQP